METQSQRASDFLELANTIFERFSKGTLEAQRNFLDKYREAMLGNSGAAAEAFANPWQFLHSYLSDSFQRSVLFWDTMRRRGDIFLEHERAGEPPVLYYQWEMIEDGRRFKRPVNYAIVKIKPPEGVVTDDTKRPYVIVDPRAGHGPGIGGFKADSEIGVALEAGHPVYFVMFFPDPQPGQTLLDVCAAEARFVREVVRRHPKSKKPVIYGNCQGGWAVMLLAASQPDITGPVVINGAPMSYWGGKDNQNPMRYSGGLHGGSWGALLASDLGNGKFDGAHLVQNFENLNPANTFWEKYYHLFANIDTEPDRFLEFEKWWGGFFLMNEQEIRWIVDNLFIGNKLERGELRSCTRQALDIKSIKSPIIVFASMGDNITPPQQAFYWIADVYGSTEEIKANGQVIVGLMHKSIGHLGIFVSGMVAKKEHSQIVKVLDHIQTLRPGLYEMEITEKPDGNGGSEYVVAFEEKRLEDVKFGPTYDRRDEMAFEAVAEVSILNEKAYSLFCRPFIRAAVNEELARLGRKYHPLRWQRWAFSTKENPLMWPLPAAASAVRKARVAASPDNPFCKMEKAMSDCISAALDYYRDTHDLMSEVLFFQLYGSMIALRVVEPEVYEEMERKINPRTLPLVREALAKIEKGGYPQAVARIGALIGSQSHHIPLLSLEATDEVMNSGSALSGLSEEELRRISSEQEVIVSLEPERALATLPSLLSRPEELQRMKEVLGEVENIFTQRPELEFTGEQIRMLHRIRTILV